MKLSRSADGLAQRIAAILEVSPHPVDFFRHFAASEAIFERAIGRLFIKGQAAFRGHGKARQLRGALIRQINRKERADVANA